MEKLNCILVLCNYLIELAKSRFNPFLQSNNLSSVSAAKASAAAVGTPTTAGASTATTGTTGPTMPAGGTTTGGGTGALKSFDQFIVADVSFKKSEQLVIYLKCLQLLKPVLC